MTEAGSENLQSSRNLVGIASSIGPPVPSMPSSVFEKQNLTDAMGRLHHELSGSHGLTDFGINSENGDCEESGGASSGPDVEDPLASGIHARPLQDRLGLSRLD